MEVDLNANIRPSDEDDAKFDALLELHGAAVYRLAVAIVGPDEAADVTQDVLVSAWRRHHQLRDPDKAAAWLRRLVVNRCIDRSRSEARRVRQISLEALGPHRHPHVGPVEQPGFDPDVDRALRAMPADHRAVLALHYAADLPIARVADALGIPVGTAKSRLHAALERLRAELAGHDG